jgi:hypothetical protein
MSQVQVTDSSHNSTYETDDLPMQSVWTIAPGGGVRRSRADAAYATCRSRVKDHLVAYFLYARDEPEEMRPRGIPSLAKLEQFPPMRQRRHVRIVTYSARKNVPTLQRHPSRPHARIVTFSEGYAVVVRTLPPSKPSMATEPSPSSPAAETVWTPPEQKRYPKRRIIVDVRPEPSRTPERHARRLAATEAEELKGLIGALGTVATLEASPQPPPCDHSPAERFNEFLCKGVGPAAVEDDRPACKTCGGKFTPNTPTHRHCPKCFKTWLASQKRERKDERPPANAKPRQTERPAPPPQKTLSPMEQAQRDLRVQREQRAREDTEIRKAALNGQPLPIGAEYRTLQLGKMAVVVYQGRSITVHLA